jgi:hypothetical protein
MGNCTSSCSEKEWELRYRSADVEPYYQGDSLTPTALTSASTLLSSGWYWASGITYVRYPYLLAY